MLVVHGGLADSWPAYMLGLRPHSPATSLMPFEATGCPTAPHLIYDRGDNGSEPARGQAMSINCSIRPKHEGAAFKIFPTAATLLLMLASPAGSQEYGYSYLRMEVAGHTIRNFVQNEKYSTGWLGIEGVELQRLAPVVDSAAQPEPPVEAVKTAKEQKADNPWLKFPAALRSGRSGPGKLRFGAGDSGGLEPLFDAQNQKSVIPEAELDFYTEQNPKFVGIFKIKGIRILSLEDMPASACGAYVITFSFKSIAKR